MQLLEILKHNKHILKTMKQITLNIQDNKFLFFMELVESMDFVDVEDDFYIPEEHKKIVLERMKKSKENPERLLDWDTVKDNFILD